MGAVAGEVLANRELQPRERAERQPDARSSWSPWRPPHDEAADQQDQPHRTTSSTRGNEPHGAGGRSSGAGGDACEAPARASRQPARRRALRGGLRRGRRGRRFLALPAQGADSPLANGQPEDSLTRHQPISIPRMPQRGRECHWRQPGSPTSSADTRTHRWRCGLGDHRLEQAAVRLLDLAAPAQLGLSLAQPRGERVAHPLQLGDPEHPRPADRADRSSRSPAGGRPRRTARRAAARAAPIWRRRSWRARRSVRSSRAGRETAASRASTGAGDESLASISSSSSGTRPPFAGIDVAPLYPLVDPTSAQHVGGEPDRLLDGDVGHALHLHGDQQSFASSAGSRPRPAATAPNRSASGLASSAITRVPDGRSPGRPSSASPGLASGGCRAGPRTRSASKARSATPDSMIAIVSASSSRFWLTNPPRLIRSRATASTGVCCSSGSRPMWR